MYKLKNKIVLITGASGGIGQELVKQFKAAGAIVAMQYKDHLIKDGFKADLTKEKEVKQLFDKVIKKYKKIDILIANAGVYQSTPCPIHQMSLSQWDKTLANNMTTVFLTAKYFFKNIEKNKLASPSMIIIGSSAGVFGEAQHADYAASKSGITGGFLYSLKNEIVKLSPLGRINVVAPGWTLTPMAEKFVKNKSALNKTLQTIALKKLAYPKDVAKAVLFLSDSEHSGHISGEILKVTGGMEGRVLWD